MIEGEDRPGQAKEVFGVGRFRRPAADQGNGPEAVRLGAVEGAQTARGLFPGGFNPESGRLDVAGG